jgi:YidC/Oxa1 family membrane protein insertase
VGGASAQPQASLPFDSDEFFEEITLNRNSLLGWILLMGMVLLWSQYKGKQAQTAQKQKLEQMKQDSLANAAKQPPRGADSLSAPQAAGTLQAAPAEAKTAKDTAAPAPVARRVIAIETDHYVLHLDNQGAKVASIDIKDIAGKQPIHRELITPAKGGALLLTLDNRDLSQAVWSVEAQDSIRVSGDSASVSFQYTVPGGPALRRTYTFYPDGVKFAHHLQVTGQVNTYSIQWPSGLSETEKIVHGKGIGLLSNFFSELVLDNGVTVDRERFEGRKTFNEESGVLRWVGLRRKYVAAVINFNRETAHKVVATSRIPADEDKTFPKEYELQVVGSNYEDNALDFDFLILPLSYDKLKAMNQNYEKIIFSGWESFFRADIWYPALCGLVLHLLNFFHGLIHNYGFAIIMLTLLVRILTFPLTITQTKSMAKMQLHTPAITKIREKHKGSPQKAQAEIMEYYKKAGINPLAGVMGCIPAFLQMPIFISLFNVLGRSVELKHEPFFGWVHDLSLPDVVWTGLKVPYLFPLGLTILPFFMAASMFFQMKMTIKDPNQKMMVWMMPIMMFVFSCSFPSGLVVYWTVSNCFTIAQTYFYTNRIKAQVASAPIVSKR